MSTNILQSPAGLVAIARAARECGDRSTERSAKRVLLEQFGIRLTFTSPDRRCRKAVQHAS